MLFAIGCTTAKTKRNVHFCVSSQYLIHQVASCLAFFCGFLCNFSTSKLHTNTLRVRLRSVRANCRAKKNSSSSELIIVSRPLTGLPLSMLSDFDDFKVTYDNISRGTMFIFLWKAKNGFQNFDRSIDRLISCPPRNLIVKSIHQLFELPCRHTDAQTD